MRPRLPRRPPQRPLRVHVEADDVAEPAVVAVDADAVDAVDADVRPGPPTQPLQQQPQVHVAAHDAVEVVATVVVAVVGDDDEVPQHQRRERLFQRGFDPYGHGVLRVAIVDVASAVLDVQNGLQGQVLQQSAPQESLFYQITMRTIGLPSDCTMAD